MAVAEVFPDVPQTTRPLMPPADSSPCKGQLKAGSDDSIITLPPIYSRLGKEIELKFPSRLRLPPIRESWGKPLITAREEQFANPNCEPRIVRFGKLIVVNDGRSQNSKMPIRSFGALPSSVVPILDNPGASNVTMLGAKSTPKLPVMVRKPGGRESETRLSPNI